MPPSHIGRPASDEYAPFYAGYISEVPEADPVAVMESQGRITHSLLAAVSEADSLYRYAPEKWSIREIAGHLVDAERIFAYRALRIARADETPIEGFDENGYVRNASFDRRPMADLVEELAGVRLTTVALFRGLDESAWTRRGIANGARVSLRAIAYVIPGHERHHMRVLKERYRVAAG